MSRYLETATQIYSWLSSLQVKQKSIEATVVNGSYDFTLHHPVEGALAVQCSRDQSPIFACHGVALRAPIHDSTTAELEVYDAGGIFDPIDGRVQGEHYSSSHFALLGAVLFKASGDKRYLQEAKEAIGFHLRTSPTEYAPFSEWMYHWDFQNYAFALTFEMLRDYLDEQERKRWEAGLGRWLTNHRNKLSNWAAMRAWAFALRRKLLNQPFDSVKARWNLRTLAKARHSDGCFDDNVNLSRPIQYHVFNVAILHRLWQLQQSVTLQDWFEAGVEYFLPFVDPEGDFNYLGRGQEQIFGYGAAVYALEAAYQTTGKKELLHKANLLMDFLLRFSNGSYFPLVLNDRPDTERNGWYDYHHLTVYNAFLGAWLGLAHQLQNPQLAERPKGAKYFQFFSDSQAAIVAKDRYFVSFYGGLPEYLTEPGITPYHIWWKGLSCVFSCPGGPSPDHFSQKSPPGSQQNFFSPIALKAGQWVLPVGRRSGLFERLPNGIRLDYDCGPYKIYRLVQFEENAIAVQDTISFSDSQLFDEIRFFNLPLSEAFDVHVQDDRNVVISKAESALGLEVEAGDGRFEVLDRIPSAKGRVQVLAKRALDWAPKAREDLVVRFRIYSLD